MELLTLVDLSISILSLTVGSVLILSGILDRDSVLTATGFVFVFVMLPYILFDIGIEQEVITWITLVTRSLSVILGVYVVSFVLWSMKHRSEVKARLEFLNDIEKEIKTMYLRGGIPEGKAKDLLLQIELQKKLLSKIASQPSKEIGLAFLDTWVGLKGY